MPEYIKTAINRISEFLPEPIKVVDLQQTIKKKITFGLSGAYDYYQTDIYNTTFIIAGVGDDEEDMTPSVLAKQKEVLKKTNGYSSNICLQKDCILFVPPLHTKKHRHCSRL